MMSTSGDGTGWTLRLRARSITWTRYFGLPHAGSVDCSMGICGAGCKGRCGSLFGKGLLYCGHPKVLTVAFRSARPEAELRFLPRPRVVGPGGPMIDTSDMLFAHRVFRRELRSAPELIGGVEAGDTKRSALVADHLGYIVAGLHHHHAAEDELLWPPLRTRVPS